MDDSSDAARSAGLRYVHDDRPGIRRKRAGKHFSYVDPDGHKLTDRNTLARIRSLAIPPAYSDVWICPDPKGHIQATGRDARGRKQYRYHPRWREVRDEHKFHRMLVFGSALPRIRERTNEHLSLRKMCRERVLAAVVRLLETTLIRVGNEEYARDNSSYGLTTLRGRHLKVVADRIELKFKGKSGRSHRVTLEDRRLAKVVKRCQELPGQALFEWVDEEGAIHPVSSSDVNDYLREISGEEITAKDFRTWFATVLATMALEEMERVDSEAATKKNVLRAIEHVSQRLGNTPAVCRKSYINPAVFEAYAAGEIPSIFKHVALEEVKAEIADALPHLPPEEAAVLAFLKYRLSPR